MAALARTGRSAAAFSPSESEINCGATSDTSESPRGPLDFFRSMLSTSMKLPASLQQLKEKLSGHSNGSSDAISRTSEDCEPIVLQEASSAIRPGQGHSECQDEVLSCRLSPEDGCDLAGAPEDWRLEGVADGHGKHGGHAARLVRKLIIKQACEDPFQSCLRSQNSTPEDIQAAVAVLASEVQAKLEGSSELEMSGTTCCVALAHEKTRRLCIANIGGDVGDSRAVLASRDASGQVKVIFETSDHKPELPEEAERITSEGGIVQRLKDTRDFESCGPPRVFERFEGTKPADGPGLAMSRSLGDLCAHRIGVSHVPSTYFHRITNDDCFLILPPGVTLPNLKVLATDGVWDVMGTEEVVSFVENYMRAPHEVASCNSAGERVTVPVTPAAALTLEAMYRWSLKPTKAKDDISAVVLPLPSYVQGEPVLSDIPKVLMSPATRNEDILKPDPIPWTIKMRSYFGEEEAGSSGEASPTSPMSPMTPRKFLRGKSTGIPASLRRKYEVQLMQNRKVGGKPILEDAPMADSAPSGSLGGRPVQEIISVKLSHTSTGTVPKVLTGLETARESEATSQGGPTPAPSPFSLAENCPSTPVKGSGASTPPLVNSRSCPSFEDVMASLEQRANSGGNLEGRVRNGASKAVIASLEQRANSGSNLEGQVRNGASKASRASHGERAPLPLSGALALSRSCPVLPRDEVIALLQQRANDLEGQVHNGTPKAARARHVDLEGCVHNGGMTAPWMRNSLSA